MSDTGEYHDFRFRFPATEQGKESALDALAALRAGGLWLGDADRPENMLGNPIADLEGICGARGRASMTYLDVDGSEVTLAAVGDPGWVYVAIRSRIDPADLPPNLAATFGLEPVDAETSAQLLGVWS
jgi:hypothetical protein